MRVIRTEMYFDTQVVQGLTHIELDNPGVSVAWFGFDSDDRIQLDDIVQKPLYVTLENGVVENFLADALSDFQERHIEQPVIGRIQARGTAESFSRYILDQPIVIEHSPPEAIPFSSLLRKASSAAIGTYIGYRLAGDSSLLLLVTIPGGMFVASSAIGISKALEKGLNKTVERALFRKKKK
jgi:hypothetical protein